MYHYKKIQQISFTDFNQLLGMQLDPENEWVILADQINWNKMEEEYAKNFPTPKGRVPFPLRMVMGALIIQKRNGFSDRNLVKEIAENPYFQYFMGMPEFSHSCPFGATALVVFRKRMNVDFLMEANNLYLRDIEKKPKQWKVEGNIRNIILDATCLSSTAKYPQNQDLLNEARIKLEEIIDYFHNTYHPWKKPRTYREIAENDYKLLQTSVQKTDKAVRSVIRKQLGCLNRNILSVETYLAAGYKMPTKFIGVYQNIKIVYGQQKYMYENKTDRIDNRIINLSQPYVRPVEKGGLEGPIEFENRYGIRIDENGRVFLERLFFDLYNESTVFQDAVERYKEWKGYYPEKILADKFFYNQDNLEYCQEHRICMSDFKLGKLGKETNHEENGRVDEKSVGDFFNAENSHGAGVIMTRLEQNNLASIALSVFVTNLFSTISQRSFLLYLWDSDQNPKCHFIIFEDHDSN